MANFPTPTPGPGTRGNAINGTAVNAGKSAAALVNVATVLGAGVACEFQTGTNTITNSVQFGLYRAPGQYFSNGAANPITTVNTNAAAGNTTLIVNNAAWIAKNQVIAVIAANNVSGELVTVTNTSSNTLTVSALANGYNSGDSVFMIEQTPSVGLIAPAALNGNWAANSDYSQSLYPPYGYLFILAGKNNDATNPVTIFATTDTTS